MQSLKLDPSIIPNDRDALRQASDEALFQASSGGDSLAFRVLVERHAALVRRLAVNVVRDEQEAEDIAQEVFVSVWRNRQAWRPDARFTTWLYRITLNKAIDCHRSRRAAPESDEVITRICDAAVPANDAPAQHAQLERKELSAGLMGHLEALPESQRRALRLFYFEDVDVATIAATMLTSEQSVRSLLKRGRTALKLRLQRQKPSRGLAPLSRVADGLGG